MKSRDYIGILFLCCCSGLVGQELAGSFGGNGTSGTEFVVPSATPSPDVPTNANSPGYEGAFIMDTNYIYTYHNNTWCKSQRLQF